MIRLSCSHKKVIKCPKCGFHNQVEGGDDLHPSCSAIKPDKTRVRDGDIQEGKIIDCKNKKCLEPITPYWYFPKGYFEVFNPRK